MENGGAMEEKAVIDFTGDLCRYAGESVPEEAERRCGDL